MLQCRGKLRETWERWSSEFFTGSDFVRFEALLVVRDESEGASNDEADIIEKEVRKWVSKEWRDLTEDGVFPLSHFPLPIQL
jgi:hypothetical protein